jgi:hypothetical protein
VGDEHLTQQLLWGASTNMGCGAGRLLLLLLLLLCLRHL